MLYVLYDVQDIIYNLYYIICNKVYSSKYNKTMTNNTEVFRRYTSQNLLVLFYNSSKVTQMQKEKGKENKTEKEKRGQNNLKEDPAMSTS